ncbi:MAG: hypothetical protein IKM58_00385 [Tidjanibacter sp.]|nr:hypothetical protein [Tidjanibacter sp.]
MKRLIYLSLTALAFMGLLSSCGAQMLASVSYADDDLYAINNRHAIATVVSQHSEVSTVAPKTIASDLDEIDDILGTTSSSSSDDLLVSDYGTAYERRLKGRASVTYNTPTSYTNYLYGDSYYATLRYDPSYYNVMVMGDQIWVEPKYVTSMFGTWGTPSISVGLSVGLPFFSSWHAWNYPYYSWNRWYWNDWYWGRPYWYGGWYGPGWHGGWYGPHHHHHWLPGHGHYYDRPGYAKIRRPGMIRPGTSGMRPAGGPRTSYRDALSGTTGTYRRNPATTGNYNGNNGVVGRPQGSNGNRVTVNPNQGATSIRGGAVSGEARGVRSGAGGSDRRNNVAPSTNNGTTQKSGSVNNQTRRSRSSGTTNSGTSINRRNNSSSNNNSSSYSNRRSSSSSNGSSSSRSGGFSSGYSGGSRSGGYSSGYSGGSRSGGYSGGSYSGGGGSRRR